LHGLFVKGRIVHDHYGRLVIWAGLEKPAIVSATAAEVTLFFRGVGFMFALSSSWIAYILPAFLWRCT